MSSRLTFDVKRRSLGTNEIMGSVDVELGALVLSAGKERRVYSMVLRTHEDTS